ncbi:MAG: hypothetical protein QMD02_09570, partial [Bacteroidales bacterium]|nr:hypothetical protein [Bacteroidales bacterium]
MHTTKKLENQSSYINFGARYYESDLKWWLSVDPMSDKYPSLSPYFYSVDNSLIRIDMERRDIWEINQEKNIVTRIKDKSQD